MDKRTLIKLYYEDALTLQEIGDKYGVTREYVRQVMKKYHLPRHTKRSRGDKLKWKSLDEYFDYVKKTGKESKLTLLKFVLPFKKQCEECGSRKNLHIHHLRYPAISLDDIQILCASCHHTKHRKGNGVKIQLEICDEYIKGKNGIELAKEHNLTPGMIYQILAKWNIKRRGRGLDKKKKRVIIKNRKKHLTNS